MSENTLVYTGPLDECGFTGPVTGLSYVARPHEPFVVDPSDADKLLTKWPTWLKLSAAEPIVEAAPEQVEPEVQEKRRARYSKASDQETDADQRDSDQDSES